ncbi:MAG TPA: hypothetical protein VE782_02215, partial [Myxococcaceae bacterium]|nr:hypothetical protein [Myxococcaceae bacterium]
RSGWIRTDEPGRADGLQESSNMRALPLLVLGAALLIAGCSGTPGSDGNTLGGPCAAWNGPALPLTERYVPLKVGASWTYQVTSVSAGSYVKQDVVEAYEDAGGAKAGTMAFRLHRDDVPPAYTLSWQQDLGRSVVRLREKNFDNSGALVQEIDFDPFKLRLDECPEHTTAGATWAATFTETDITGSSTSTTSKSEQWTVDGVDVPITVPAGTFTTLNVSRMNPNGKRRQYWFAKGVGKVKEVSDTGVMESLSAYTVQ